MISVIRISPILVSILCPSSMPYEMGLFVENHFKVYGSIQKVVSTKRDKAKTIYINLGYDDPIKEGLRFDVVEDGLSGNKFQGLSFI